MPFDIKVLMDEEVFCLDFIKMVTVATDLTNFVKSVATVTKSTMSYTTCFYVCGWPKNLIFLVSPT